MTITTTTVWGYDRNAEELAAAGAKAYEMFTQGKTNDVLSVLSAPGELPVIKQRVWTTVDDANEWKTYLESCARPPLSCTIDQA